MFSVLAGSLGDEEEDAHKELKIAEILLDLQVSVLDFWETQVSIS